MFHLLLSLIYLFRSINISIHQAWLVQWFHKISSSKNRRSNPLTPEFFRTKYFINAQLRIFEKRGQVLKP